MQAVANAVVPPGTALGNAAAPRSLRPRTCKLSWLPLSTPASSWAPQRRPAPSRQFRAGCRGGCCHPPNGPGHDSRVHLLLAEDVPAAVVFRVRPRFHMGTPPQGRRHGRQYQCTAEKKTPKHSQSQCSDEASTEHVNAERTTRASGAQKAWTPTRGGNRSGVPPMPGEQQICTRRDTREETMTAGAAQ